MRSVVFVLMSATVGLLVSSPARAEIMEPFFKATGFKENHVYVAGPPAETVDPHTGNVSIVHRDLSLPQRGQLQLEIVRRYDSKLWGEDAKLLAADEYSAAGLGWSLHMGRLHNPHGDAPVYEAPDGTQIFFYHNGSTKISGERWVLDQNCKGALSGNTVCVFTDRGIRYEFNVKYAYMHGSSSASKPRLVRPVTRIADVRRNAIDITYQTGSVNLKAHGALHTITDSYGRRITFEMDGSKGVYRSFTANGKRYHFGFKKASGYNIYLLEEFSPPSGGQWRYEYNLTGNYENNLGGLSRVTYPYGGTISYTYTQHDFHVNPCNTQRFPAVVKRVVSGRGVTSGTWQYQYVTGGRSGDRTTITRPDGHKDVYTFYGLGNTRHGYVWRLGLPMAVSRADGAEKTTFTYARGHSVAAHRLETPAYGSACVQYGDPHIYAARKTRSVVVRDGKAYTTTLSNFDKYDQARSIEERSDRTRTRRRTFYYNEYRQQRRGYLASEDVRESAFASRLSTWRYNGYGELIEKAVAGVKTSLSYDGYGRLSKATDALNKYLTLSNYRYGVAQTIGFHTLYAVRRTVDWWGRIISRTNGRGYTTRYNYDAIGRVISQTPAVGAATTKSYGTDHVMERRGSYWKKTSIDGFGRTVSVTTSGGVNTRLTYDAMNRVVFRSYPFASEATADGDRISYDGIGRTLRVTHADGTYKSTSHSHTGIAVRNERGYTTRMSYAAFGRPDDRQLHRVVDANGQTVIYTYGKWGKLTSVDAPGTAGDRRYTYDAHGYLSREWNAETGLIRYGRNLIGQITFRQDEKGRVTYRYDSLHRPTFIDTPDRNLDLAIHYDKANNVIHRSSGHGGAFNYSYDGANRLTRVSYLWRQASSTSAELKPGSSQYGGPWREFDTRFGYNANDCLTSTTYPSGRVVPQSCDTLNRPVSIGDYLDHVSYHPNGQVRAMTYGNGVTTTFSRDKRGRVVGIRAPGVVDMRLDYDGVGNVILYKSAIANQTRALSYDAIDRLSRATGSWGTASFSYDALGNRTKKTVGGKTTTYSYNSSGRLFRATGAEPGTYRYDSIGNLLEGNGFTHSWSATGQLISSSNGYRYAYDGLGRRVRRTLDDDSVLYHYDHVGNVIAETRPDGSLLRETIYIGRRAVAVEAPKAEDVPPWEPDASMAPEPDAGVTADSTPGSRSDGAMGVGDSNSHGGDGALVPRCEPGQVRGCELAAGGTGSQGCAKDTVWNGDREIEIHRWAQCGRAPVMRWRLSTGGWATNGLTCNDGQAMVGEVLYSSSASTTALCTTTLGTSSGGDPVCSTAKAHQVLNGAVTGVWRYSGGIWRTSINCRDWADGTYRHAWYDPQTALRSNTTSTTITTRSSPKMTWHTSPTGAGYAALSCSSGGRIYGKVQNSSSSARWCLREPGQYAYTCQSASVMAAFGWRYRGGEWSVTVLCGNHAKGTYRHYWRDSSTGKTSSFTATTLR